MQVVGPTLDVIRVRSKRMPKLLPKDMTEGPWCPGQVETRRFKN